MKVRVLIVDDSPLMRTMLKDILGSQPDIEVVGTATDGLEGIQLAKSLRPDVITMDVEMPRCDGLQAVGEIMKSAPCPIIMISTLTSAGAEATIEALSKGAIDFLCKPANGSIREFRTIADEICHKVRTVSKAKTKHRDVPILPPARLKQPTDSVIVIASSTGGPRALASLWQQWPKGLNAPILIVQHMPKEFTGSLASRLNQVGTVPCKEAQPGDVVTSGMALMAPGGLHMRIGKGGKLTFDEEPTIHGVRPAADYLFETAADLYGSKTVGIVLTGMGRDGAKGAKEISNSGGIVFGESEETATVYGMPKAAKELDAIYAECPIYELGHAVIATLARRASHAS